MNGITAEIGRSLPRLEAREKVTGRAVYIADLTRAGMLHGATVRSPAPRGRIQGITFDPGIPWHEFTIVTAKDIPGDNAVALMYRIFTDLIDGIAAIALAAACYAIPAKRWRIAEWVRLRKIIRP